MRYTIAEIAEAIGGTAHGETDLSITQVSEPADAGETTLALAMKPEYADTLGTGSARAALLWEEADWQSFGLSAAITVDRPRFAMSSLSKLFDPGQDIAPGIHPAAFVDETAELGAGVRVGPGAVIMARAKIGAGSSIGPQAYVGADVVLGAEAELREQVSIGRGCVIGDRFIAQPGARIGGDGFSFVTAEPSAVEQVRASLGAEGTETAQSWTRIHSLGSVVIGDDVEIGANACIDVGTVRATRIGSGTKIDNLAQVGHNTVVGRDCMLCGLVGVSGSVTIGNNVVLAGQTGVNDNISIGDRVVAGGASKLFTNVPEGRVMLGHPATQMDTQMSMYRALRRLPRVLKDVAALKKAVFKDGSSD